MRDTERKAVLLVVAILLQLAGAKKFGGSGGGFRGSSGARANPPPQSHGGFGGAQPNFGGARPMGGGFGGGMPSNNFRPPSGGGPGHFGGGSGLGSAARGTSFKTALAGAALGTVGTLLAFEAGKAIIHSFDRPFQHDGRNYYWGPEYVQRRNDEFQCSMPFDTLVQQTAPASPAATTTTVVAPTGSANATTPVAAVPPEQALAQATFPNGTRPKQIVWTCKERVEMCCGTDCCPVQQAMDSGGQHSSVVGTVGKVLMVILLVGLLLCCCCGLMVYKFCRSAFDSFVPRNSPYDPSKYDSGQPTQYPHQAQPQSYPMQPYPGSAYPPNPQPPPQHNYPQPTYPPAPGYYEHKY